MSVRVIVPPSVWCPQCRASAETIRAWRAFAQIFYVCSTCEAAWTVDVDPIAQTTDVMSKIKKALS